MAYLQQVRPSPVFNQTNQVFHVWHILIILLHTNSNCRGANDELYKKFIRRWDSEREFFYDNIVHAVQNTIESCINSATYRRGYVLKHTFTKFSEITQCNDHYAVQGHSRSPILVAIESSYTSSSLINHLSKGTPNSSIEGSMNVTFSRRRYVDVFLAVCDGAPSCRRHPCKMPALLLQDATVTLDNNWDNKHVVSC